MGMLLLPLIGSMVVTLPLGGPIADRVGPLPRLAVGLATLAAGLLLLARVDGSSTYAGLWPPMLLIGMGTGLAMTPSRSAAPSGSAPWSRSGGWRWRSCWSATGHRRTRSRPIAGSDRRCPPDLALRLAEDGPGPGLAPSEARPGRGCPRGTCGSGRLSGNGRGTA